MRGRAARLLAVLLALAGAAGCDAPPKKSPLRLVQTIPMPDVEGRIDHLALESGGAHLAVAALGNDTVEILDLAEGRVVHRIRGIEEPQGIVFLADGRLCVTSGGDGSVRFYEGGTWKPAGRVDLGADADNVRREAGTARILVGHGHGAIAVLDGPRKVADVALAGHPESFQLEGRGPRVFVNVPAARHVAVLDRAAGRALATWPLEEAGSNFPMALDEEHGRLFVGCRSPARLLILDTAGGKTAAALEITGDVDDIWVEAGGTRAFLSCGGGAIDVVEADAEGAWRRTARVPTAAGARTSLHDASAKRLYLAVPHRGTQGAEVRVYAVGP